MTQTASLPIIPVAAVAAPDHRASGIVLAVVSALAFSSSGPLVKPLLEAGWSLGAALLLRMAGGAIILSPWLIRAIVRERGFLRRHGIFDRVFDQGLEQQRGQ